MDRAPFAPLRCSGKASTGANRDQAPAAYSMERDGQLRRTPAAESSDFGTSTLPTKRETRKHAMSQPTNSSSDGPSNR